MALHILCENLHMNYVERLWEWTRRGALSKSGVESIFASESISESTSGRREIKAKFVNVFFSLLSGALTVWTKYLRWLFSHAQPSFQCFRVLIQVKEDLSSSSTSYPAGNLQYSVASSVFHSFSMYLLRNYYVPSIFLGMKDILGIKETECLFS